jgi:hypothetical protein
LRAGRPFADNRLMARFDRNEWWKRQKADAMKEAEARRELGPQILEDAVRLVETWNARLAGHMPMLFSPTIEAAIAAGHWFLHARCPACRTTGSVDLRELDWHPHAVVTSLIPKLSCRGCRPHAPFAELLRLSPTSIADELDVSRNRTQIISE